MKKIFLQYKVESNICPLCERRKCKASLCRDVLSKFGYFIEGEMHVTEAGKRRYATLKK
jgi:hypothetical protein